MATYRPRRPKPFARLARIASSYMRCAGAARGREARRAQYGCLNRAELARVEYGFEMSWQGQDQFEFMGIEAGFASIEEAKAAAAEFVAARDGNIAVIVQAPENADERPDPWAWWRVAA